MKIRELFTRIGFDINDKPLKQLDSGLKQVKTTILAMSGAAVAAGGVLIGLARSIAKTGDNARRTAQALGLTTEAYQELEYVASLGDVRQGEYATALGRLSNSAMEASLGLGTCKRAYDALGISVTDSIGQLKNTDILIMEIADRFSQMEDGATKSAHAFDLFGRSGAKLIPILNGGAAGIARLRQEARESSYGMSDESARAAEEFHDSMRQNREIIRLRLDQGIKALVRCVTLFSTTAGQAVIMIRSLADTFESLAKVIRYASYALAGLVAVKFLDGLRAMVMGTGRLISAFQTLTAEAMAAGKAALPALPLLVETALAAFAPVIKDMYRCFRGDNSISRLMVEAFEKKYPRAFEVTGRALQEILDLYKEVKDVFNSGQVRETGLGVDEITGRSWPGQDTSGQHPGYVWKGFKSWTAPQFTGNHSSMVNAPRVSVNAPITVNVPGGTPQQEVGPRVQAGVKEAIGEMLRQTYWATAPQVEY